MGTIKVNTIENRTGSTLTLGKSGTTIQMACGASQSGFGRTGTVDWQTSSIKTANFTAEDGKGYFCNTTGGAFEVDLPAGTAGKIVAFKDYAGTWDSNNLTIDPNGSQKIGGGVAGQSTIISTESGSVTLVYVDDTQGWLAVNDATEFVKGGSFIQATGGNSTVSCGNFKIHVFTGPGNFVVSGVSVCAPNNKADYIVVGGGGGAGLDHGGAGGAGGFRESPGSDTSYTASPRGASPATSITLSTQTYPIVIGAGGAHQCTNSNSDPSGRTGSNSSGLGITANGGGGGGAVDPAPHRTGGSGASGGSGGSNGCNPGGTGNTPPTNPAQGTNGGNSVNNPQNHAGGGGGATVAGTNATGSGGGNGGAGASTQIINPSNSNAPSFGSPAMTFAGGGGGGSRNGQPGGTGGSGGGGRGQVGGSPVPASNAATDGTANTGGGGGSSGQPQSVAGSVGSGGSGIVMIRYKAS